MKKRRSLFSGQRKKSLTLGVEMKLLTFFNTKEKFCATASVDDSTSRNRGEKDRKRGWNKVKNIHCLKVPHHLKVMFRVFPCLRNNKISY